jgi:hypothetical protein
LSSPSRNGAIDDFSAQAMGWTGIASVVAFCLAATLFYWVVVLLGPVGRGEYPFPDAYMHLVRAAELLDGGGWYDHRIERGNAPYGETLHWTRPFDLILLAPAVLLQPFLEARDALFWAGALLAPVLTVVTCLTAAWAIGPLVGAARFWILPLLFLQWPVLGYGFPGRADHHIVILLLLVLVLGLLFRAQSRPDQARWPLLAGLCHGFGLWIAAEFVIVLAISLGFLSLCWVFARDRAAVVRLGRDNLLFSLGLLAVAALGVAAEHPPDSLWLVEYDRISIVHGAMAGLAGAVWLGLGRLVGTGDEAPSVGRRLLWLVLVGGAAAGLLVVAFPGLTENPMNPQLAFEGLRSLISEVTPLFPNTPRRLNNFLISLALVFVAAPALVWILATRRLGGTRACWWLVAGAGLIYLGLSLWQLRFSLYLSPFLVIPVVYLMGSSHGALTRALGRGLARVPQALFCVALVALPFVLQQAHIRLVVEDRAEVLRSGAGCRIAEIAHHGAAWLHRGAALFHPPRRGGLGLPPQRGGDPRYLCPDGSGGRPGGARRGPPARHRSLPALLQGGGQLVPDPGRRPPDALPPPARRPSAAVARAGGSAGRPGRPLQALYPESLTSPLASAVTGQPPRSRRNKSPRPNLARLDRRPRPRLACHSPGSSSRQSGRYCRSARP